MTTQPDPPQLQHVPTLPELARRGLARQVPTKASSQTYEVSPEGHALLGDTMRANGLALRAHNEATRAARG